MSRRARALLLPSLLLPLRAAALTILADGRGSSPRSDARAASGANATEAAGRLWPGGWLAGLEQLPSLADAALRPPGDGAPRGAPAAPFGVVVRDLLADSLPELGSLGSHVFQSSATVETSRMAPVGTLFVTLACGLAALLLGGWLSPLVPRVMVPYIVCFVYIFFSCAIDISIAVQKQPDYSFNPVCAVLVTEGIKLCLSTTVYAASFFGSTRRVVPAEFSFSDMLYMAVPAAIYSVNNILVFHAIQQNSMSDFGIFRDTMILWTASLWRFVFKVPLGRIRLLGILVVFLGLVVNKVASTLSSGEISWRFLWVVAMTLCNSAGSVANEYALKRNSGLDINVQNMLLYIFCTLFTAVILLLTDPTRFSGSLSTGFSSQTWLTIGLQSIVGLLIARLLKYSDAVMKSIATCLRGPLVVLTAPLFTHVPTTTISCLSAVIVASGCLTYLTQGPISAAGRDAAAEDDKKPITAGKN